MHWRRKWQPTPVFLPGESQGRGSLVGCRLWGRTELDTTEATWQQQEFFKEHPALCKILYSDNFLNPLPKDTDGGKHLIKKYVFVIRSYQISGLKGTIGADKSIYIWELLSPRQAQNPLFREYLNPGKKHDVAWALRSGGPLRVRSHVSTGTVSGIICLSGIFLVVLSSSICEG